MGLRKLTQWEETVAKQEQKQSRLMSVAIVCVIAMCAVLWLVQDKLYGCGADRRGYLSWCFYRRRHRTRLAEHKREGVGGKTEKKWEDTGLDSLSSGNWWSNLFEGVSADGGATAFLRDSCPLVFQNTESGLR